MRGISIPIEFELTPRSRAFMEAIAKALPPERVSEEGDSATVQTSAPPAIGRRWDDKGGIYAGISRGQANERDVHLILLDDKPVSKLNWADAVKWAQSLGNGASLPTRFESALLYANLQEQLDTDNWHWTSTQYSEGGAWLQDLLGGSQLSITKSYEGQCRAVRRLAL